MSTRNFPISYLWFLKSNSTHFVPWDLTGESDRYQTLNNLFVKEHNEARQVESFGSRQDIDTYCGFEVIDGEVKDKVIVFHPSWQNPKPRNIILAEYDNIFDFIKLHVLAEMQEWIKVDDITEYFEDDRNE
jgi:hypothetical protein